MELYHFQINPAASRRAWSKVRVRTRLFSKREDAVALARRAAKRYRAEVRLTSGPNPLMTSGSYFNHLS